MQHVKSSSFAHPLAIPLHMQRAAIPPHGIAGWAKPAKCDQGCSWEVHHGHTVVTLNTLGYWKEIAMQSETNDAICNFWFKSKWSGTVFCEASSKPIGHVWVDVDVPDMSQPEAESNFSSNILPIALCNVRAPRYSWLRVVSGVNEHVLKIVWAPWVPNNIKSFICFETIETVFYDSPGIWIVQEAVVKSFCINIGSIEVGWINEQNPTLSHLILVV